MRSGLLLTLWISIAKENIVFKENSLYAIIWRMCHKGYKPVKVHSWKTRCHLILTKSLITKGLHLLLVSKIVWRENTEIKELETGTQLIWLYVCILPQTKIALFVYCNTNPNRWSSPRGLCTWREIQKTLRGMLRSLGRKQSIPCHTESHVISPPWGRKPVLCDSLPPDTQSSASPSNREHAKEEGLLTPQHSDTKQESKCRRYRALALTSSYSWCIACLLLKLIG